MYWPDVTAVVALAVLTAAYFWTLIFTNDYTVLAFPDDSIQSFTWYQYLSRALGQGVFPLWDPYTLSGHSFIGEIQTGVFYPPNLILALASAGLPISSAQIESLLIIHVFMASLFTYALARYLGLGVLPSLVSGVAFAFGGVVIDRIQAQTNIFLGLVWLPLALLCLEAGINKRSVALSAGSGLSLALALLAGHIEPPYHIAIALVSLTAWHIIQDTGPKRFWAILCGLVALVTGGLASAVQILPSIEYAPLSMRALGGADLVASNARVPYTLVSLNSVQFANLLSVILPRVLVPADTNPYLGVAVVVLAIAGARWARHPWIGFLVLLGLFGLLTALGPASIVHGWEYVLIPLSDRIREADRRLYLFQFGIAMLAGFGVASLLAIDVRSTHRRVRRVVRYAWPAAAVGLAVGSLLTIAPNVTAPSSGTTVGEAVYHATFVGLAVVSILVAVGASRITVRVGRGLVLAVVVWDLFSAGVVSLQPRLPAVGGTNLSPDVYYAPNAVWSFLAAHTDEGRVSILTDAVSPNLGDVFGIRTTRGHGATIPTAYWQFLGAAGDPTTTLSQLLGIRYYVSDKPSGSDKPIVSAGQIGVYSVPRRLPDLWIVHEVQVDTAVPDIIRRLQSSTFDPARQAVVDRTPPKGALAAEPTGSVESATVTERALDRLTGVATLAAPGLLVADEIDYPGWLAYLDGSPADIVPTNAVLRGVYVPAGTHVLTFVYRPKSVDYGLILTLVSLLVVVFGLGLDLTRRSGFSRRTLIGTLAFVACLAAIGGLFLIESRASTERASRSPSAAISLLSLLPTANIVEPAGNVPPVGVRAVSVDGVPHQALLQHPSSQVTFEVSVSNGARLLTTTGIDPQCLSKSDGADFEISVLAEGVSQAVYHRVAAVPATAEQSIWSPVKIDLSQYAGKQIRITFSTGPGPANIYDCDWTEWIDPVIVGN